MFRQPVTVGLGALCIFCHTTTTVFCAPTEPAFPALLNAANGLNIIAPKPLNHSICGQLDSLSTKYSVDKTFWSISDTLSLALVICNWSPDPDTIKAVLAAAATTVGKKPAAGLLDGTFTQRSKDKYNTLYFEITPDHFNKGLTWEDVAEVVGENGLPKFYEKTREWHTVYFDVVHYTRGELGQGTVRRWWQIQDGNGIRLGNDGVNSH